MENTVVENTVVESAELTNAQIYAKIKELSELKKTKRDEVVKAVDKLWADYSAWRENEYKKTRAELLKKLDDRHADRIAKREERQKAEIAKAEEAKRKADEKLAALKAAAEPKPAAE